MPLQESREALAGEGNASVSIADGAEFENASTLSNGKKKAGVMTATVNIAGFAVPAFAAGIAGVAAFVFAVAVMATPVLTDEQRGIGENAAEEAGPSDAVQSIEYSTVTIDQNTSGSFSYVQFSGTGSVIDGLNQELRNRVEDAHEHYDLNTYPENWSESYYNIFVYQQYVTYLHDGIACVCDRFSLTYGGALGMTRMICNIYDLNTGKKLSVEEMMNMSHADLQGLADKRAIGFMQQKYGGHPDWFGSSEGDALESDAGEPATSPIVYFIADDGCYAFFSTEVLGGASVGAPSIRLCDLSGNYSGDEIQILDFKSLPQSGQMPS